MSDEQLRMSAYYYEFTPTGRVEIDRILSAVATAGKSYHHTEMWADDSNGPSLVDGIQEAANEAAAAIAAARAEGEKAGRDAGVAIGAANMRETCALVAQPHSDEAWSRDATTALDVVRQRIAALALPADATAILAAERAAGREEMRRACVTLVRQTNMVDSDPEGVADEIRALVLP